ncbi:MAG: response regulator [Ignavibacteriales bacterium]|nr:response regulator [Ignavibacteriales bacterium]
MKILSHVSDEQELFISGYQLDETHFIITFRDHTLKIQQKLLYLVQGLFSDSDVSKLRAFGVSRFTIFSAQRLFKLLDARFEIIQKMGTPFDIGLILSLDAQFHQEEPATEAEKEKVFKPALTAEKISITDSEFDHLGLQQSRPVKEFGNERLHEDRTLGISHDRIPKEEENNDYSDFDFDSELDFLTKRRKKEQEKKELLKPKSSFDESLAQRDIYTETPRRRDTQEISGSYNSPGRTHSESPAEPVNKDIPQRYEREKIDNQPPQVKRNEDYTPRPVKSEPPTPISEEKRWEQRAVPATPQPEPAKVAAKEQTSEFRDASGSINLSGMNCLYIEDQLDSQILFKVQMKDMKSIKFAQSFEDAIPLLENEKFDFIVLDINLQGEYNGLDALKIIRTMDRLEDIPILAVTAYVLPGDKEKFIATGFTDFVSKPIFRNKMVEVLSKIF